MRKQTIIVLCQLFALLASSSPAPAQSLRALSSSPYQAPPATDSERQRAERERAHADLDALNTATWVYISTAAADWSVTAVCARVLCGEHTQTGLFLRGVEDERAAIPLGLAIDAVIVIGLRELVAPDHPKIARVLLYGLSGARVVVTANKINDLREHARRQ